MHFFDDPVCQDIIKTIAALGISEGDIHPLGPRSDWHSIEEKIRSKFTKVAYWADRPLLALGAF